MSEQNKKLIQKWEAKILQLEQTNRELERQLAERGPAVETDQESRRALAALMSNLPGMAYRCLNDGEWTMLFLSQGVKQLTGYEPSQLIDNRERPFGSLIHPDDRETVWQRVQEAVTAGRPFTLTYRIMTQVGEEKWVWEQGCQVAQTETGTAVLEGFVTDITERKRTERSSRENEEKYRLLVENQSDMVVKFDDHGRLLFVSPSYCRTFGKSEEELVGSTFMPLIHEDDREAVASTITSIYEPPHHGYVEERAFTVDGWRWQAWVNTAVLDEQERVIGIIACGRDITDRKRAEDELERHRDHLDELVAERTRELTEAGAALQEAHRRLLNVGEDERKRLARDLHDSAGQKLVATRIFIESAASACEGHDAHQEEVQGLRQAARQCAETIQEIQSICSGLYPLTLESRGLPTALRQLALSCEPTTRLDLHCQATVAEVRFDPEQEIALFRIAQEAVSNIQRHSNAACASISLERQGPTLKMTVRDDGAGFDTERPRSGGMGLRSMAERARAIGGTIAITSRPGETKVDVNVPAQLAEAEQA